MRSRLFLIVVASVTALIVPVVGAGAQTPTPSPTPSETPTTVPAAVTLRVSDPKVTFGKEIGLRGEVSPALPDQEIVILDEDARPVASGTTAADGSYRIRYTPRHNVGLRAEWGGVTSDEVGVKVLPRVRAELRDVDLFGRARVSGRVRPGLAQQRVTIKLKRAGRVVAERTVATRDGGRFSTRFEIKKPGRYRAKAIALSPLLLTARDGTARRRTALPSLAPGSRGGAVKRLERRLVELGYHLTGIDNSYDYRTSDAMIAFNKAQRAARVGTVDAAAWRRLASPIRPKPRFDGPRFHIEIDQTRQLIFVVKKGRVKHLLHTSTGAGGATYDGTFTIYRKIAGYSGGRLYYPSYWEGRRAIHGWPEVPTYNASHGCARVPMWAAQWIYGLADIGTRVYIYH